MLQLRMETDAYVAGVSWGQGLAPLDTPQRAPPGSQHLPVASDHFPCTHSLVRLLSVPLSGHPWLFCSRSVLDYVLSPDTCTASRLLPDGTGPQSLFPGQLEAC